MFWDTDNLLCKNEYFLAYWTMDLPPMKKRRKVLDTQTKPPNQIISFKVVKVEQQEFSLWFQKCYGVSLGSLTLKFSQVVFFWCCKRIFQAHTCFWSGNEVHLISCGRSKDGLSYWLFVKSRQCILSHVVHLRFIYLILWPGKDHMISSIIITECPEV